MIGDQIALNERYLQPAVRVLEGITVQKGYVINVVGESGSASAPWRLHCNMLKEQSIKAVVLRMDDYFILPPTTNHAKKENRTLTG